MDRSSFKLARCAVVLSLLCAPGCGTDAGNRADVTGKVTLNGARLENGSILFVPAQGTAGIVTGGPIAGGRYRLAGNAAAAVGWNRVEIRSPQSTGRKIQYAPGTATEEEVIEMVAPRFHSGSTLLVEVQPGANTLDFEVQSE